METSLSFFFLTTSSGHSNGVKTQLDRSASGIGMIAPDFLTVWRIENKFVMT